MGGVQCCTKREKDKEDKLRGEMLVRYMRQIERKPTIITHPSSPDAINNQYIIK